ncbi:MAG: hypothetical protein CMH46_06520 [Muricauda sp.]|nr:hypothetical protein [Allomuricauda sp.]|tara:strand:+ start:4073 stop:4330 length:258 start_codon:yes stop_codon:yes gene_type:complete
MAVFFETLGWLGTFCFLFSYFMLIKKKWSSHQSIYHWFNILGSVFFIMNGAYYSAWSVIFVNFAWGCIAVYGLMKDQGATKKPQQ